MGAVARLAEQELRAPRDDLFAESDEGAEQVLQRHHQRTAAVERHDVGAERGLQRREAVELVEHNVGHRLALELDHDAVALPVALVAEVGNAVDLLLAHKLGDALDHRRLVHLVRDFRDDEGFALLADGLDFDLSAHDDRAAAILVSRADSIAAEDDAAGRKIRPRHDLDQVVDGEGRIVDQRNGRIDDFAEIVRRNIRGHADCDATGAVDQQIRETCRQHHRLALVSVVVFLKVDGVLVDVVEQRHRRARQPAFGVAHGRRRIAVDRAEIALPVDQHQAHGKILRHADQRVVNRLVAVRVILAHHVADHTRRFHVFLVGRVALLVHRVKNAPMHGLEAVTRIRQRTRHDHAHGVIEIAALHFLGDRNRAHIGRRCVPRFRRFGIGQDNVLRGF